MATDALIIIFYLTPGYLTLFLVRNFAPYLKKIDNFTGTAYSVTLSFFIWTILILSGTNVSEINTLSQNFLLKLILATLIVSIAIIFYFKLERKLKNSKLIKGDIWHLFVEAVTSSDTPYAIIQLKNGLVFAGILKNASSDDEEKELVLENPKKLIFENDKLKTSLDYGKYLYINSKDIVYIRYPKMEKADNTLIEETPRKTEINSKLEIFEKERNFTYLFLTLSIVIGSALMGYYLNESNNYGSLKAEYHKERMFFYIDNNVITEDNFNQISKHPEDVQKKINFYHEIIQSNINAQLLNSILLLSVFVPFAFTLAALFSLIKVSLTDLDKNEKLLNHTKSLLYYSFVWYVLSFFFGQTIFVLIQSKFDNTSITYAITSGLVGFMILVGIIILAKPKK